jgi:ribosomal protein S18 acetylase RimI-like enzyme
VRIATESDYSAIAGIQRASPEAAQWADRDYAGFSILLATDVNDAARIPAGFCIWRQTTKEEAELLNLAVLPAHRRRGAGSALLAALEDTATGDIFLEVAESNSPAIAFYEHHGWVRSGVRKGYYHNGCVNAIVMQKGPC